jgi:lipopolysaccharide export system permease protein
MQQVPQTNTEELQRLYFNTDFVRIRNVGNKFEETSKDTYKSEREMSVCEMDSMYQNARHEEDVARQDLATTLASASHLAATGEQLLPPQRVAPRPRRTIGSLYCGLVKDISPKVENADAAEVQATAKAPPQAPRPEPPLHKPQQPPPVPARNLPLRPLPPRGAPTQGVVHVDPDEGTRAAMAGAQAFGQTLARLQIASSRVTDSKTTASRYAVEIQKKFALAAACAVFVLLGAPVGLRFPRGGVGMVLGVSIVVFGLYYIGLVAGEAAANRLVLSPFWGMWATNVICTVIGIVLMFRVQRSGATARGGEMRERLEALRAWLAARRVRRLAAKAAS